MARLGLLLFYVILCCVSAAKDRHECDRLCLENESPKKCYYHFTIGVTQRRQQNAGQVFLSINGESPGPLISVCQNDIIVVDVKNQLPSGLETSIHWHGLSEGNSPFMDGVPMITQCPITPHTTFRYQLQAHKSGSFFYRAHSVSQQLDGVHGPVIVRNTKEESFAEKIIFISPWMKKVQVFESSYEQDLNVTALQIQVYNLSSNDGENTPEKLRIINGAALDCPVTLFTHIVPLKVVAVDGFNVKPVGLNEIIINPGERVDLLVKSEVMKMTHIVGHNLCKGHAKYGFDPGISDKNNAVVREKNLNSTEIIHKLESEKPENLKKGDVRVLLSFDSTAFVDFKGAVDFRYKLGALTPYAPSVLSKKNVSMLQFHEKSFLYPPSPILSQPDSLQEDLVCRSTEISSRCKSFNNGFCECLQIINLPYNYNVDLFLIDEGIIISTEEYVFKGDERVQRGSVCGRMTHEDYHKRMHKEGILHLLCNSGSTCKGHRLYIESGSLSKNGNTSQTIHIHGHSFFVLSMKSFDKPISTGELWRKEVLGEVSRNLVNPIRKDTIVVPNKGYVTLRFRPTNPGKWLVESITSKAKTGYGLEVILNVENPAEDQVPPDGFPTCGNMKEPDLVFNDD